MAAPEKKASEHARGINAAIAAELRAERAARGMNNQDIAELSGISKVSVQRYLAPTRAIDMETLEALAAAVGCTVREIVLRADERRQRELTESERAEVDAAKAVRDRALRETRPTTKKAAPHAKGRSETA